MQVRHLRELNLQSFVGSVPLDPLPLGARAFSTKNTLPFPSKGFGISNDKDNDVTVNDNHSLILFINSDADLFERKQRS